MNWRETPLERLSILLPCKPDRAQRTVHLAQQEVSLSMAGCEAAGALFAISHVRVAQGATATTSDAWRVVTMANMRATVSVDVALNPRPSITDPRNTVAMNRIATQGKRLDGTPVQAQLAWIVAGQDIYQIAVYADRLTPDMLDTLFSDIKIQ